MAKNSHCHDLELQKVEFWRMKNCTQENNIPAPLMLFNIGNRNTWLRIPK